MLIIGIMLAVLFVFSYIACTEVSDATNQMARILAFVFVVPFVIVYAFIVPYKGPSYIEEKF